MRRITIGVIGVLLTVALYGCAHLDFNEFNEKENGNGGVTYYDPKPYLFVSTTKECVTTAPVVVLPEKKRTVKFKTGYGSAELSVNLSNGMITSVNQKADTKIPETLGAIVGLGTAVGGLVKIRAEGKPCIPSAELYPIENGVPNLQTPIQFPIKVEK